ncbi:MAG TPA: Crp/Fnr family transcriptional regulator [Chitinophagaceae bacterium]|nr:Crp/Fnr family transcriptional regulator [Chitinophagaceae bacterium]MCB9055086.1 Crp/Fnr family transcriptional regulator [Chitinophagales bacterium]HPG09953.1 Crp/Fnr family transcriptional regulator [Chitinophagaceae bacterium]HRX93112.1 Crp/Fnr family transcriptional regulator [Chitinophagaceae bacterium]
MTIEAIYDHLNQFSPITTEAWQDFMPLLEEKELPKNEMLVREGDRVRHCYLLTEGIVRVYYNKEGNEYNKTFFVSGTFPTPITALLTGEPCQLNFQALANCRLFRFSYAGFRELFEKHRCFESLMLKIMELQWIKKEQHDIHMVTNDAAANYAIFQKTYPGLEQLIPQYHIASYLGITPIQLSRIRAQMQETH